MHVCVITASHAGASTQVMKQECKLSTIITVTSRLTSAQEFGFYYDKVIVMRECSEGSRVAEMGQPQDLLADPSSMCVCLFLVHAAALVIEYSRFCSCRLSKLVAEC